MARQRDYRAERQRRNERARALGFSSLDQLNRARKAGNYPTAKAIRTETGQREIAERITARKLREKALKDNRLSGYRMSDIRKRNKEWSRMHSRQSGTRWNDQFSDRRAAQYFNAFVRNWYIPDDERRLDDIYDYMDEYISDFPEYEQDRGGYRGKHAG